MNASRIEIFKSSDTSIELRVKLEDETVWLNQEQMSALFERDRTVIGRHIQNIFKEGELDEKLVCANFAHTTQHGAIKGRTQQKVSTFYNLDVIISIGYRVKSQRGTQFRIWATQRLKDYLVQGYAINEKRLAQKEMQVQHLKTGIQILSRAIEDKAVEAGNEWLLQYAKGLALLDDYDHENLDEKGLSVKPAVYPAKKDYQMLINTMKADFDSAVFGVEKDQGFESAIHQIAQSFGGQELYPTLEEKAAMLLYLITKNHAFADGNKRIAAACFLLFLEQNNLLKDMNGKPLISNEALAGLTLFVAVSKPQEMETVKKLIISVLNRNQ
jgi:prophage maintenance system killer protein